MHYVYLIRSITEPQQTYIGINSDLQARMKKHNAGGSPYTAKHKPWALISYHTFNSREKAAAFEQYLKAAPPSLRETAPLVILPERLTARQIAKTEYH